MRLAAHGMLRRLGGAYLALFVTAVAMMLGVVALVEMLYHVKLNEALGPQMTLLGVMLDTSKLQTWLGVVLLVVIGGGLFEWARRSFSRQWERIQDDIEARTQRRAAH